MIDGRIFFSIKIIVYIVKLINAKIVNDEKIQKNIF